MNRDAWQSTCLQVVYLDSKYHLESTTRNYVSRVRLLQTSHVTKRNISSFLYLVGTECFAEKRMVWGKVNIWGEYYLRKICGSCGEEKQINKNKIKLSNMGLLKKSEATEKEARAYKWRTKILWATE